MWKKSKWLAPGIRRKLLLGALTLALLTVLCAPWLLSLERALIQLWRGEGGLVRSKLTHCLYQPTCSQYGLQVLDEHGFWRGNLYLSKRLVLCSPIGYTIRLSRGQKEQGPAPGDQPSQK